MNQQLRIKSYPIFISSLLAIIAFFSFFIKGWGNLIGSISAEIIPILINLATIIPAILGLWKFSRASNNNKITVGGYVVYGVLMVVGYLNAVFANDPLGAGLPMVLVVMPYAVLFSIYLFVQLKRLPEAGVIL